MMTMMGVGGGAHLYLSIQAPPADLQDDLSLPPPIDAAYDSDEQADGAADAYTCDEFRMYEFKVRRCARGRSHDWTECPYAHPGEKARRRDPRRHHYSGAACPDFRKGMCRRGEACELAHGVFECWLHPSRYRTQPCKDGVACRRRVCFFAHTPDQLRVVPSSPRAVDSYDGSPLRRQDSMLSCSPPSTLLSPASESPPVSPMGISEVLASLRQLQISKMRSMERSWGVIGSPRGGGVGGGFGGGFCSLPSTPTGMGGVWAAAAEYEEPPVARVESGRALRARMFERLSKGSGIQEQPVSSAASVVDWVSELLPEMI